MRVTLLLGKESLRYMKVFTTWNKGFCTMFWDKIADYYIGCCCKGHDKRYANKRLTRLQADILLFKCVKRKANVILAATMFSFVRAFGWYFYNKVQRELNKASELAVY